jgi:CelD/BcsL family acetyltransferase involved in cellulose biosynthesis
VLRAQLICELEDLQPLRSEWDRLAIDRGRPFCAPAWMLSWWRHVAPAQAKLRTVAVFEGDRLSGIAPFFAEEWPKGLIRYRLLGSGTSAQLEPLARDGLEREVAEVIATYFASAAPRPDVIKFEGIRKDSPWPALLREVWPNRTPPLLRRRLSMPSPTLSLSTTSYAEWLSSLSSGTRSELRRRRRRITERGGVFRLAESEGDAIEGLREFAALHYDRWSSRGGSGVLTPEIERMLADAARELVGALRFRLWSIAVDDRTISSQVFLAAGGNVTYWLGGFDQRWAPYGPSIQAVWAAIEHAWTSGDTRMDMGPGGQDYKYVFADGEDTLQWIDLLPRTLRAPITRVQLVPELLRLRITESRHALSRRLSPKSRRRMQRILARLSRHRETA